MPTTFNTTDPKPGYVYEVATDTWFPLLGIAPGSSVVRWRKTAAGAETSVSGLDDLGATLSYNAGTEQVYLNGVLLVRTEDYLATTGTSVTGLTALAASDVIEVISFNATNVQITVALLETDINAKGDLIVGAAADTAAILTSGTNGQVLSVNTATATGLAWVTSDDANAIQNAIVDAKGDIIAATAADTVARLAVGANGTVLTAASGEATGLQWATPSSGGMTLINSGGTALTGSSVTVSSIPGTYKHLLIIGKDVYASGNADFIYQLNGDTGNNYTRRYVWFTGTCLSGNDTGQANAMIASTGTGSAFNTTTKFAMNIYRYAETEYKFMDVHSTANNSSKQDGWHINNWDNTAAITSITFLVSTGSFSGGTIYIYGVN